MSGDEHKDKCDGDQPFDDTKICKLLGISLKEMKVNYGCHMIITLILFIRKIVNLTFHSPSSSFSH